MRNFLTRAMEPNGFAGEKAQEVDFFCEPPLFTPWSIRLDVVKQRTVYYSSQCRSDAGIKNFGKPFFLMKKRFFRVTYESSTMDTDPMPIGSSALECLAEER